MQQKFLPLSDQDALAFLKAKNLKIGFSHYDVWLYQHAVSFTVAKMMDADLLADTKAALETAIAQGQTFAEFQAALLPTLKKKGWWGKLEMADPEDGRIVPVDIGSRRLRNIFYTNIKSAHAAGRWAHIQETAEALPYLKYIASTAEEKRQSHMPYYGRIYRADDPIWHKIYPPNGYGCRCSVRQLTAEQAKRERGEDIDAHPEYFTEQQIANHKNGILDDNTAAPPLQETLFENPRTKEKTLVPQNITPTFAMNPMQRLQALEAYAAQKHGKEFAEKTAKERADYIRARAVTLWKQQQLDEIRQKITIEVGEIEEADKEEIERLARDPATGREDFAEAEMAVLWQKATGQKLERFRLPKGADNPQKPVKRPDFWIADAEKSDGKRKTLDFMFVLDKNNKKGIENLNKQFNQYDRWAAITDNISGHLMKADFVPLDLRSIDSLNREKLISFVLSLTAEQQRRVFLIESAKP